jgi:4-hydroxybenzoate polyprenyltransferase
MALVREYRAERFPAALLIGVPSLVAFASEAGRSVTAVTFVFDTAIAALLFAQFRIVDDLADRERDGMVHPDRVLVQAPSVAPIVAALAVQWSGTLAVLAVRDRRGSAVAACLLLNLAMAGCYAVARRRTVLTDHLLLAKYAAFVWIVAISRHQAPPWMWAPAEAAVTCAAGMAMYLAACVYEAAHDPKSPSATRPRLVAAEGMLLLLIVSALSLRGRA